LQLSVGAMFVGQEGDRTGVVDAGLMYLIVSTPNPPWVFGLFEGAQVFCGIPT